MQTDDADTVREAYKQDDELAEQEQQTTRRYILCFIWAVIVLAVPGWWHLTSIERLSIPEARIENLGGRKLVLPVRLTVDESLRSLVSVEELANALDIQRSANPSLWDHLKVEFLDDPHGAGDPTIYTLSMKPCDDVCQSQGNQFLTTRRKLIYLPSSSFSGHATRIAETLEELLVAQPSSVKAQYSSRYRLAFSLLNEDSSLGGAAISWDIEQVLNNQIYPTLDQLSVVHNFSIESQVQYHAPLAFEPQFIRHSDGLSSHSLSQEDIKIFVNSAEWILSSSVNNDQVLHFLLFIPSAEHQPLHILDSEGQKILNSAFLIPQWGGVVIHNPLPLDSYKVKDPNVVRANHALDASSLASSFSLFRNQLYSLLGVPSLPSSVVHLSKGRELSEWQIDNLLRSRVIENTRAASETLESIVKLVHQIDNMPVKKDVRGDVIQALDALEEILPSPLPSTTGTFSIRSTLLRSADAFTLASRAFFNPGMLAMLYFPTEHTYAVYTPLFLPIAVPLIVTTLKEIVVWRKARAKGIKEKTE